MIEFFKVSKAGEGGKGERSILEENHSTKERILLFIDENSAIPNKEYITRMRCKFRNVLGCAFVDVLV